MLTAECFPRDSQPLLFPPAHRRDSIPLLLRTETFAAFSSASQTSPHCVPMVNAMKRIRWVVVLPLLQLSLATALFVYEPFQWWKGVRARGCCGTVEYFVQNYPAPAQRISNAINFPVLLFSTGVVLPDALTAHDLPLVEWEVGGEKSWFTFMDRRFFLGVAILWLWVGAKIDARLRRTPPRLPRISRIAGAMLGSVYACVVGYAAVMAFRSARPFRQIGPVGLAWCVILLVYFIWRLKTEFTTRTQPLYRVPTDPMIFRLVLGLLYLGTALLMGDWSVYTEIAYEANHLPVPGLVFVMAASSLLFLLALLIVLFELRPGAWLSLVGCLLAAPACLISVAETTWRLPSHYGPGDLPQHGAVILVLFSAVSSFIVLRRQPREGAPS